MGGRGEEVLVGGVVLVLALVNAWRIWTALRRGEVPLYRTRLRRADLGRAKFAALVALNVILLAVLLVIAFDLLFMLDLRGR
ncbi:MAG: hypothetical protein M3Q88_03950 [Pseudomonadota bacterium]|nr:hypothetical protein [Pseudomonadota bacterium]